MIAWSLLAACLAVGNVGLADPAIQNSLVRLAREQRSDWHRSYEEACRVAQARKQMLLIQFHSPQTGGAEEQFFDRTTLADASLPLYFQQYVLARLPLDARISVGGQSIELIKHPAFVHLEQRPGLAIIDYSDAPGSQEGLVVSTLPVGGLKRWTVRDVQVLLTLPPGTLTQRTMIFAVRIHPEAPASTVGQFHPTLAREAAKHSQHQANIVLQGHHNWDSRFQQIGAEVEGSPQEVCAESWPGEGLLAAAIECVRSWRQSHGHWSAVRSRQGLFGYDMKRGRNGIWYATGIFANRNR